MNTIKLSIMKMSDLEKLAKFIVEENFSRHDEKTHNSEKFIKQEIKYIYDEESSFSNSKILVAKDNDNTIIGSIRTLRWNQRDILPIEKMFSLRLKDIIDTNAYHIWHIGRFAIRKDIRKSGFILFKTLMAHAIYDVCAIKNSIAIAECDAKLLKTLRVLGIEAIPITNSIHYLGSETVPVILTYQGLKNFLNAHSHLLSQNNESLHQSVVLSNHQQYYTFV